MSTRVLHLDSPKIDKATSGAYYLLFNNGGHTGNLVLDGSAYLNYINASGLAVQNGLVVTGSQTTHGNATFFSFNNLANLSVTGGAYINNLTGTTRFNDVRITGESVFLSDIGLSGNFNATGVTNITGSLYVNGVQITGVTTQVTDIALTGDFNSLYARRGDIMVGTGVSGFAILNTGSSSHGKVLKADTGSIYGVSYGSIVPEVLYERQVDLPIASITGGSPQLMFVATRRGTARRAEGDVTIKGDVPITVEFFRNGFSLGSGAFLTLSRTVGGSSIEYNSVTFSSPQVLTSGDFISFQVTNNGEGSPSSVGAPTTPASGQLRVALNFEPLQ